MPWLSYWWQKSGLGRHGPECAAALPNNWHTRCQRGPSVASYNISQFISNLRCERFSVTSWYLLSVANKVLDIGVSRPASLLCAAKAPAAVRLLESIRSLRRTSLLKLPEVDWRQGNAHKIHTSLLRIVINFQCSSLRPNEATTIPRHCCQQVTRLCRVNHAKTNLLTVDFSN